MVEKLANSIFGINTGNLRSLMIETTLLEVNFVK